MKSRSKLNTALPIILFLDYPGMGLDDQSTSDMAHLSQLRPLAPQGDKVTSYDRERFELYLRLIDAEADGADWKDVACQIMGLDLQEKKAARACWQSHLKRARWMSEQGYLQLLDSPD